MRNMICDQREKEMETPRNDSVISGFVFLWCHGVQSSAVRAKKWLNWNFTIVQLPPGISRSYHRQQTSCEGGVCELIERQEAPIRYRPLFLPSLKSTPMEHLVSSVPVEHFLIKLKSGRKKTVSAEKKLSLCFSILWTSHTAHYLGVGMVGWTGGA